MDEFFKRLAKFRGRFNVCGGFVSESATARCPILAVADGPCRANNLWLAFSGRAGLPDKEDAKKIVRAADNRSDADPIIRARILETLGLTETT